MFVLQIKDYLFQIAKIGSFFKLRKSYGTDFESLMMIGEWSRFCHILIYKTNKTNEKDAEIAIMWVK